MGPQLLFVDLRLFLLGLFSDCFGPRIKSTCHEENKRYIDRLEYLSLDMDETIKEYDIFAVHKITKLEQEIASILK